MNTKTLAAKAIVPVALSVTGFVVMCCVLLYAVMKRDMMTDTVHHEAALASTIVSSGRYAMLQSDREAVRNIVENVGAQQGVTHVRIFNKKGLIKFSARSEEVDRYVDRKAPGCVACHAGAVADTHLGPMQQARHYTEADGRQILAITAPIYNEPACYQAACHVHSPEQKLLGTLDIGLSTEPLQRTLLVLRGRMALFAAMVLVLTVGGVTALLRRNVLLPIHQLAEAVALAERGEQPASWPRATSEVGRIADAVQRMAEAARTSESRRPERTG